MLKLDLKIAIRNLLRYKFVSFITIFGLAVGIACCTVVFLFVKDEYSYDRHNIKADRTYRIVKDFVNDDGTRVPDATTPPALLPTMVAEIPEIESAVRVFPGWGRKFLVKYDDKKFLEENVFRVDSNFFDVFTVNFLEGNPNTAFTQPRSIVITESSAKKYFGKEEAMNKSVELDNMGTYTVSAVIKDPPRTAHFSYDFLISIRTIRGNFDTDWGFYNFYTYITLKESASIDAVVQKIQALFVRSDPENKNIFYAQLLPSIHLNSHLKWELGTNSDAGYIYIIILIALFIIVVACINYVNLSTARSSLRAKEIGIRKVSGAERLALIRQFITESILIALLATFLAVIMAQLILPSVNHITGKTLLLISPENTGIFLWLFIAAIIIGFIAGIFPALYLSSFESAKVLKGIKFSGGHKLGLRKGLVIFQFTISIILIVGAMIISRQVGYIQSAKLGFNKEQVVMISDADYLKRNTLETLKHELMQVKGIKNVGTTDGIIGGQNWTNSLRLKGSENSQLVNFLNIDVNYFDVMQLSLKEGRTFSPEFPGDTADAIILNETAVKQLGIPEPVIGQQIVFFETDDTTYYAKVIGVVKDFHFTSLRSEIKAFAFVKDNSRQWYYAAKLDGSDVSKTLAAMQTVWEKNVPERPFQYFFLDETFNKLYQSERNFKTVFFYITLLIIFISCLGLFGLSSFTIEQRTKEIGIRKVLGASVAGIVQLLSKDFLKLVTIASVIAFPIAWWGMSSWLQDFAYRINISWSVFAIAFITALAIAFFTISFQALKAAVTNPVKSLRTE